MFTKTLNPSYTLESEHGIVTALRWLGEVIGHEDHMYWSVKSYFAETVLFHICPMPLQQTDPLPSYAFDSFAIDHTVHPVLSMKIIY